VRCVLYARMASLPRKEWSIQMDKFYMKGVSCKYGTLVNQICRLVLLLLLRNLSSINVTWRKRSIIFARKRPYVENIFLFAQNIKIFIWGWFAWSLFTHCDYILIASEISVDICTRCRVLFKESLAKHLRWYRQLPIVTTNIQPNWKSTDRL
jgi:hypothetical protein